VTSIRDDIEAILDAEYRRRRRARRQDRTGGVRHTVTTWGGQIALQNLLNSATTASPRPPWWSISYGRLRIGQPGAAGNNR